MKEFSLKEKILFHRKREKELTKRLNNGLTVPKDMDKLLESLGFLAAIDAEQSQNIPESNRGFVRGKNAIEFEKRKKGK